MGDVIYMDDVSAPKVRTDLKLTSEDVAEAECFAAADQLGSRIARALEKECADSEMALEVLASAIEHVNFRQLTRRADRLLGPRPCEDSDPPEVA